MPLTGSANQQVICMTALGRERYSGDETRLVKRLQVSVDDAAVWLIGIPRAGDLDAMAGECERSGVLLKRLSWRT